MASNNGSIDEIISKQGFDDVEQITQKMNTLYVAFKQNVTAINLMNDALSKATTVKDVTGGIDNITTKTKKANQVVTEFIETQNHLDKAVTLTGHALNEQELAYAKLTATMGNGNKAAKLVTETTVKQTKDTNDLKTAYARLNDEYKASLVHSKNLAIQYGVTSKEFKAAAAQTNLMGAELKAIDSQLGIHSKNVGNYAAGVEKGMEKTNLSIGKIWGGLRQLAYLIPGIGLAGMFNLAFEAIGKVYDKIMQVNEATQKMKDIQSAFDKAVESGYQEVAMLQALYDEATNVLEPMDKRLKAVDALQKQYPEYFKNLKDEKILAGDARDVYIELSDAIEQSVINRAFLAETDEMAKDLPKQIMMLDELTAKRAEMMKQGGDGGWVFGAKESAKQTDAFKKLVAEIKVIPGIGEEMAKKILATGDGSVSGAMNSVITELSTNVDAVKGKIQGLLKYANDNYGKTVIDPVKGAGKTDKPKEVNRIDDLKKEYEARKVAEQQKQADMPEGLRSEVEYRHNLLKATEEYVTKMHALGDKLSTNEKSSRTSLHKEMLDDTESNTKNLEKIQSDKLKKDDEYYKLQSEAATRNLTEQQRIAKLHADDEKKRDEEEAKHNSATIKNTVKTEKEIADIKQARYNMEVALLRSSFDIANSISDAIYAKELQQIEDKATALEKAHNNEIRFIEESGMTSIQQTKAKKKADAEYEAEKKKIDKDRKKALYNQALLNKALTMSEVVLATTLAVMNALSNKATVLQSVRFANAIAAGAIGTAQLIKAAAVKLPQYAKGRGKGKDEMAIVGEAGTEAIIRGDGRVEITPNRATTTFLKADDQVISNSDLIRSIQNSAYVSLSNKGTFTTDKLQNALINEFEKNTNEIKDLKKVLINKNLSVNTTNYGGFDSYLKAHIR